MLPLYQNTIVLCKCFSLDINECEEYNDCHHSCTNTEGFYYCSCNEGFILAEDNRTCTGCNFTIQNDMDLYAYKSN